MSLTFINRVESFRKRKQLTGNNTFDPKSGELCGEYKNIRKWEASNHVPF
jgi:hypothetical protein